MRKGHIYLLIGPKGSGKSFIGTLFNTHFDIEFVKVEHWILELKKDRELDDPHYIREAFQTIEEGVRKAMETKDCLVFESTGLTDWFDQMLARLKLDFSVTTIRILTDPATCMERVRTRDQSIHINVSDDQVDQLNAQVLARDITTDFTIENTRATVDELKSGISRILENRASSS